MGQQERSAVENLAEEPKTGGGGAAVPDGECQLCGGTNFRLASDQFRGGRPATILECLGCGLQFQRLRGGGAKEIYQFYRTEYPGNYQYREELNRQREALLAPCLKPDLDVLEIGCSSGEFLSLIRPRVRSVAGVELVPHDVAAARERYGLTIYDCPVEELDLEARFDLIMTFQTFEHIPDPNGFLCCLRRLLRPEGRLVIEMPNVNEPLLALYRLEVFRRFYYVPPHLFFYSQTTLPRMLAKNGFVPGAPRLVQMGTLTNHLHWIYTHGPQRNLAEVCSVLLPEDVALPEVCEIFEAVNRFYVKTLVERGYSDTLWLVSEVDRRR